MDFHNSTILEQNLVYDLSDVVFILNFIVSIPVSLVVSFIGTVANMFNLFIFLGPTHKDSLPIGLVALSFSDLCLEFLAMVGAVIKSLNTLNLYPNLDLTSLLYILSTLPGSMFYDVSAGTVVLISLEKCVCVFSPFNVKQLITRKRMAIALAIVYTFEFSTYGSMFSSIYLSWESYPSINYSLKLVLITTDNTQTFALIYMYVNTLFYLVFTQFVVGSCSILLIISLSFSAKFRKQIKSRSKQPKSRVKREARLVKTVLYIAVSFCLSNQFLIGVTVLYQFGADFGRSPVHSFLLSTSALVTTLNGAINIVIYYKTNSKYRGVLKKIIYRDWFEN